MGQCTSTLAVEANEAQPRATSCVESASDQEEAIHHTSRATTGTPMTTLQFSVSLDPASEHSVCIRLELTGQDSSLALEAASPVTGRHQLPEESLSHSPKHYQDICFTAPIVNPQRLRSGQVGQEGEEEEEEESDLELSLDSSDDLLGDSTRSNPSFHRQLSQKIQSRRSAFRQQQQGISPSLRRLATSDGALLKNANPECRHPAVHKENSWYLGQLSADSLDLQDAMLSNNKGSLHTASSWGGLSIRKSLKGWQNQASSVQCENGGGLPTQIDISMNDVSGNTLPTRCEEDYSDCCSSENGSEVVHWEYRRKIREFFRSPNGDAREDAQVRVSCSSLPGLHASAHLVDLVRTAKLLESSNNSRSDISRRSCQSEPGFARTRGQDHDLNPPLEPWNPQKLPSFRF